FSIYVIRIWTCLCSFRFLPTYISNKLVTLTAFFSYCDMMWDFVTGFHKRKKKRRKEAQRQLQEKERLKRIESRKKVCLFC
ncbi:hypothetical protein B296_00016017, partial [Ensete ventricosum]